MQITFNEDRSIMGTFSISISKIDRRMHCIGKLHNIITINTSKYYCMSTGYEEREGNNPLILLHTGKGIYVYELVRIYNSN
jgi:hypothetical protein